MLLVTIENTNCKITSCEEVFLWLRKLNLLSVILQVLSYIFCELLPSWGYLCSCAHLFLVIIAKQKMKLLILLGEINCLIVYAIWLHHAKTFKVLVVDCIALVAWNQKNSFSSHSMDSSNLLGHLQRDKLFFSFKSLNLFWFIEISA